MKSTWFRNQFGIFSLLLTCLSTEAGSRIQAKPRISTRVSPNTKYFSLGEPLTLNVTVNIATCVPPDFLSHSVHLMWYFRRFLAKSYEQVLEQSSQYSYKSTGFSLVNKATLVLFNTSVNDSGIYKLESSIKTECFEQEELFFNVTILDGDKIPTSPSRSSPNSIYVIEGKPLKLLVNTAGYYTPCQYGDELEIKWHFRHFFSMWYTILMSRYTDDNYGTYDEKRSFDGRLSFVNKTGLLLVNTTPQNSGIYRIKLRCTRYFKEELLFNATVGDINSEKKSKTKYTKSSSNIKQWYYRIIAFIVGLICGAGLIFFFQRKFLKEKKWQNENERLRKADLER